MKRTILLAVLASVVALAAPTAHLDGAFAYWSAADSAEGGSSRSATYREGQKALDAGRWSEAADLFARVAGERGDDADAALYWQAYALAKQGMEGPARAALRELRRAFPQSGWLDDAQVLEAELQGPREAVATADAAESEELKLYALNGLLQMEPARALPVLRKLLQGDASPRLKKQALFVLGQSDSAEARQLLASIARGQSSPNLQREAIQMLGVAGGDSVGTLMAIYRESGDRKVKEAVLHGLLVSGADAEVLAIARGDGDLEMRRQAIHQLGVMGGGAQLREIYAQESDPELRRAALGAMGIAGDAEALAQAARGTTDATLRRSAIHGLGLIGTPAAGERLAQLYADAPDRGTREAVLDALFIQGNAARLIELFRREKDAGLRRVIVQKLSLMDSPEATELLLEMIDN